MPDNLKPKDIQKLNEIRDLLGRMRIEDALDEALAFTQARPRVIDGWELLVEITETLGETFLTWLALRQLCHLDPHDDAYRHDLALCALKLDCPYLCLKLIDDYLKRFPNSAQRDEIVEVQTTIRQELAKRAAQDTIPAHVDMEALADLDEGRLWISYGETGEGRRALMKAARRLPNNPSVQNNIALSYAVDGNLTKALEITNQVLAAHPDNLFAQAIRGQLLVRLGREDEARTLIHQLAQENPTAGDPWIKIAEACAYAHEHQLVLNVCERGLAARLPGGSLPAFTATLQCFIGTAQAFLGNQKKARAAWKKVIPQSPYYQVAQANLDQHRTHGPFYFLLPSWMPRPWLEGLADIGLRSQRRSPERLRSEIEKYLARTPGLAETVSLMFERGDPIGLETALHLADMLPLPGLVQFAAGSRGTDDQRMSALNLAQRHGLIPEGQPFTMLIDGKPTDIIPLDFEVYYDTDEHLSEIPAKVQAVIEETHTAFMQKEYADALAKTEEGIAKFPDQLALYNFKANALRMLNRHDEADAITRWLVETHPTYFFGRIAMADLCLRHDRLDEVEEWLTPLRTRKRYHISEFRALARVSFRKHAARKELDDARQWISFLEQFDPDSITDEMRLLVDIGSISEMSGRKKRKK